MDGEILGEATIGLSRPGVSALFPGYPESPAPGWIVNLDTTRLSDGRHDLEILVRDDTGAETYIGKRQLSVFNP